ncbi:DUF4198 domain-containing protein [Sphingobacterium sp. SRCM116780]|uniref:DUF4198 domain-containing protein n=1 Tax=Sphingobacterium sp. SRCM116780 TaxID=2907623 RepID=UPI001F390A2A|nr:DUF4198 domain-containing protein [Sphingobacterium sp. SRCM116780]UIR55978.1 DUF4198 domain-containing protein [Sphingobacterium sp. SRCM116780]
MKNVMTMFYFALLLLYGKTSSAHALWIETQATGQRHKPQEVKIFYGEFANNEREAIDKWYSDVKDFTLWLYEPGKEVKKLEVHASENNFSTTFTPTVEGIYYLAIIKEPKDLGGKTKYEFSSLVPVRVGKVNNLYDTPIKNPLQLQLESNKGYKKGSKIQVNVLLDGQKFAKAKVSVFSAAGWSKEFEADEHGVLIFDALWSGPYVLEVSRFVETTGEHAGKAYTSTWQGATTYLTVN